MGVWLECHAELPRHPKTKRLMRSLGLSTRECVGTLLCLWLWSLEFAPDGDLSALSLDEIAEAADWRGDHDELFNALVECGFVESDDAGVRLHDWQDYGGKAEEQRRKWRERKAAERERKASEGDNKGRGAKRAPAPSPAPPAPLPHDDDFERFWRAYPRKVEKPKARAAWATRIREKHSPELMVQAAELYAQHVESEGTPQRFVKHAATFIGPKVPYLDFVNGNAGAVDPHDLSPDQIAALCSQADAGSEVIDSDD